MLHIDLASFVYSRPIFHEPIRLAYTPQKLIADPEVLARLCYKDAPQNAGGRPYLTWMGPYNWDQGLISEGALSEKVSNWWFTAYTADLDDAVTWISNIETDIVELFVPGYFYTAPTGRIASMTYVQYSKHCVESDQVQQTAKEHPYSAATICFQIGWQE